MHHKTHYNTISEALKQLHKKGFDKNIYIKDNAVWLDGAELKLDDLEIIDVYRYEGKTNPADAAIVYAIKSKSEIKGAIVNGYGISANNDYSQVIKRIPIKNDKP